MALDARPVARMEFGTCEEPGGLVAPAGNAEPAVVICDEHRCSSDIEQSDALSDEPRDEPDAVRVDLQRFQQRDEKRVSWVFRRGQCLRWRRDPCRDPRLA